MHQTKLPCGCIPDNSGYGYCDKCCKSLKQKIWSQLSEKQKDYDRYFSPYESAELDDNDIEPYEGCSCHINPPCSYCTKQNEEDYE